MGFMLRRHHQLTPFAVTVPARPPARSVRSHYFFFLAPFLPFTAAVKSSIRFYSKRVSGC